MTTINSLDDFLRALDENPSWKDAVRARILGEELLQLPVRFNAFVEEQRAFNCEIRADIAELKSFTEDQRTWNRNATARFDRMEGVIGSLKGFYIRTLSVEDAPGIASDMGLEYVRTLSRDDLNRMVRGSLSRDVTRSFRNADVVMEVTDGQESSYIAMEISFTADSRESDRVMRNAGIITQFTGKPARPAIASVRNDHDVTALIDSGTVYWHPLEDRGPSPE